MTKKEEGHFLVFANVQFRSACTINAIMSNSLLDMLLSCIYCRSFDLNLLITLIILFECRIQIVLLLNIDITYLIRKHVHKDYIYSGSFIKIVIT